MAASLLITGYINRVSSQTSEGKTSYFARIAYTTGRKDEQGQYPKQYIDAVFGHNLKGTGETLLASVKETGDKHEHALSRKLLNLKVSNPFFHVYDGRNEGKGSFLNSDGVLLEISPADSPQ